MSFRGKKEKTDLEVDVVVVGGGGAGLPAALAAVENNVSRVLVLEKRSVLGGNATRAWGIFATQSMVQKQNLVDARNDIFFRLIMDWSHWKTNPEIWRAFISRSGDTILWLEKKGIEFELLRYFPNQEPPVWHVPQGHGAKLVEVLAAECLSRGVQILPSTRCTKILVGNNHQISGVLAENEEREFSISARAVVVASGGFAGNTDLLRKYCPDFDASYRLLGLPHDGDGLRLATQVGAATADLGSLLLEWPSVKNDPGSLLATAVREPYAVYVNNQGKRFVDETLGLHPFEAANSIIRQPLKASFILLDSEMIGNMEKSGAILGRGNDREKYRREMKGLEGRLREVNTNGTQVKISGSWQEIASWIGCDPANLSATIDQYNAFCDRGNDAAYAKRPEYLLRLHRPPFYCIKGELVFLHTLGGLKVNEHMQVLNSKGAPIAGLFAAGVDTGGWVPDTYCDKLSGTAFGFAVNSGRIAGENSAKLILQS